MTLNELDVGKTAVVTRVGGGGALRQHFLDMGILPGARLKLVRYAPLGKSGLSWCSTSTFSPLYSATALNWLSTRSP